ncbi:MAG: 50S ribosomal protein L22 [Fimbriiglobus sp.]
MLYVAKHRFADVSPRKMRPFAQLVRGKNVDEALEALKFYPNRGARLIEAVIKSAYGNAEDRNCPDPEELIVKEIKIDGGPMFKRIQPRARGTAFGILRRLSHIIVALELPASEETTAPEATTEPTTSEAAK